MSDTSPYVFVSVAGRMVQMPQEYAHLIEEAVEAETRRCAELCERLATREQKPSIAYHYRRCHDEILKSAGLDPEVPDAKP